MRKSGLSGSEQTVSFRCGHTFIHIFIIQLTPLFSLQKPRSHDCHRACLSAPCKKKENHCKGRKRNQPRLFKKKKKGNEKKTTVVCCLLSKESLNLVNWHTQLYSNLFFCCCCCVPFLQMLFPSPIFCFSFCSTPMLSFCCSMTPLMRSFVFCK